MNCCRSDEGGAISAVEAWKNSGWALTGPQGSVFPDFSDFFTKLCCKFAWEVQVRTMK